MAWPRRARDQHHVVLGDGRNRIELLAVLCTAPRSLDRAGRRAHRSALRLCRISEGFPAAAAVAGGRHVREYHPLDQDGARRTFSRSGTACGVGEGDSRIFPDRPLMARSDHPGISISSPAANSMPKGYWITRVDVYHAEQFEKY